MTCLDWQRFAAVGDDLLREGSPERLAALEHAEACPSCGRALLRLDPSLAVSGLASPVATSSEVDAIKRNVIELRRLREVEDAARPRRRLGGRLAAVAVLTVGILMIAEDTNDRETGRESTPFRQVPIAAAQDSLLSEDYRLYGSLPLVESLDPSEARVYQLGRDDFSLVWIVDESIEVVAPSR